MTGSPGGFGGANCVVADRDSIALLEDIIVHWDEVSKALLLSSQKAGIEVGLHGMQGSMCNRSCSYGKYFTPCRRQISLDTPLVDSINAKRNGNPNPGTIIDCGIL
ncbi:hypothetical protein N7G274_006302 [Stereocaulon virgatum]|uniref:Uncharacterized protein n=1 Tax=Stereocaulon virgatum TaxID=373712 RepID=A0ABR4A4K6_9LECA